MKKLICKLLIISLVITQAGFITFADSIETIIESESITEEKTNYYKEMLEEESDPIETSEFIETEEFTEESEPAEESIEYFTNISSNSEIEDIPEEIIDSTDSEIISEEKETLSPEVINELGLRDNNNYEEELEEDPQDLEDPIEAEPIKEDTTESIEDDSIEPTENIEEIDNISSDSDTTESIADTEFLEEDYIEFIDSTDSETDPQDQIDNDLLQNPLNTINNLSFSTPNEFNKNIEESTDSLASIFEDEFEMMEAPVGEISMLSDMPLLSVSPYTPKLNEDPSPYEYLTIRIDKQEYRACYPLHYGGGSKTPSSGWDYNSSGAYYYTRDSVRPNSSELDISSKPYQRWNYYRNCYNTTIYQHFESWAEVSNYLTNLRNTASVQTIHEYRNSSWYEGCDYSNYDIYFGITIFGKSRYLKENNETISKKWLSLAGTGECGDASGFYDGWEWAYHSSHDHAFTTGYKASSFDNQLEFIDIQADISCLRSMEGIFEGCRAKSIYINNNSFDRITDMSKLFKNCSQAEKIYIAPFSAPVCTDMSEMFSGCVNLTDVNLTAFDTHYVRDMHDMFKNCKKMENYDFSNFNTQEVVNMSGMFQNNLKLQQLALGYIDTRNVTSMANMFNGNNKLVWVTVTEKFSTKKVVDNGSNMFLNCVNIEGEKMTEYDALYTDVKMAQIDRGGHNWGVDNGYFRCGHLYYETVYMSTPTCTEDGEYGTWCKGCHNKVYSEVVPALGHIATWVEIRRPYCFKVGTESFICERCNQTLEQRTIPMLPHSTPSFWEIDIDATCTKSGINKKECLICNYLIATITSLPYGHQYEWTTIYEATCSHTGTESNMCRYCHESIGIRTIPIMAHGTPYNDIIFEDSTCVHLGVKESWCLHCGEFIGTFSIALKSHSFSDWENNVRKCMVCGYTETRKVSRSSGGGGGGGGGGNYVNIQKNTDMQGIVNGVLNNMLIDPSNPLFVNTYIGYILNNSLNSAYVYPVNNTEGNFDKKSFEFTKKDNTKAHNEIITINGKRTYFGDDYKLKVGWINVDNQNKMRVNDNLLSVDWGSIITGYYNDNGQVYYFDTISGLMLTGWQKIDGSYHYFAKNSVEEKQKEGTMYINTYTPDGYYVNEYGVWVDNSSISSTNTDMQLTSLNQTKIN